MNWFFNLKIRTKLIISFIILAVVCGIVGFFGITNMKKINRNSNDIYTNCFLPAQDMKTVQIDLQEIRSDLISANYSKDFTKFQDYENDINKYQSEIDSLLSKYEKSQTEEASDREMIKKAEDSMANYKKLRDANMVMLKNQQYDEASADSINVTKAREQAEIDIQNLVDYNVNYAANEVKNNSSDYNVQSSVMIIIIIASVVLAVILGLLISGSISRPIGRMVEAANSLALGDVNVSIDAKHKDEMGSLSESLNNMIQNIRYQEEIVRRIAEGDLTMDVKIKSDKDVLGKALSNIVAKNNEVLSEIVSASDQVAVGAKQISDSSIALSEGATEQASSVEELTSSMEELASQTKLNAQNATKASEDATHAKENAVLGKDEMQRMLKAMDEINEASTNINKIIKVIDDIAFQTNILALNAAVEAARAGQHGKGFAVVAEEVRNLAARSANAAKETTDMIENSMKKSEGGTKIAKETAQALNQIVDEVEEVTNLINSIAVASNEQASGIEQVNQGIMQVSEVVQNNSATSEEAAAASEELSSQADVLKEMVGKYKLKKNTKTGSNVSELSPEILKMLEDMANKNKTGNPAQENAPKNSSPEKASQENNPKHNIVLSDNEFGKY